MLLLLQISERLLPPGRTPPPPGHMGLPPPGAVLGPPHIVGAALWGLALLLVLSRVKGGKLLLHHRLLAVGFAGGFLHEASLLVFGVLKFHQLEPRWMAGVSPVLLGWLAGAAATLVVGGFLSYLCETQAAAIRYLRSTLPYHGVACLALCVPLLILPGRMPLGLPRPAYALIAVCVSVPVLGLGAAAALRYVKISARWPLVVGIALLAIAKLLPLAGAFEATRFLMPALGVTPTMISSVGVVLFGYLYVRIHSAEIRDGFSVLEEQVRERNAHLETALESLAVANSKLAEQSSVDGLTGVRNRRFFDEALSEEWARATRASQPLAIAMVDLDQLKRINDQYGHQKGDECLVCMATVLQGRMRRPGDVVARFGGDEFAVLLPNTTQAGAFEVLEEVRLRIAEMKKPLVPGLSISVGIAVCIPDQRAQFGALLRSADERLYAAKRAGRNRVVWKELTEDLQPLKELRP